MITLDFHSTDRSQLNSSISAYANTNNELFIMINDKDEAYPVLKCVALDKETAIKLVKELRKQISFLD